MADDDRPPLRVVGSGNGEPPGGDDGFKLGISSSEPRDLRRYPPKVRSTIRTSLMWRALELRVGGASYPAIAAGLKCSLSSAHRYVTAALQERAKVDPKTVEEYRSIQLERIRSGVLGIWSAYVRGDGEAVRNMVRLINLESILTGTRAPIKFSFETQLRAIAKESGLAYEEILRDVEQLYAEGIS